MRMRFMPDEPIVEEQQDDLGVSEFVTLIETSLYDTHSPYVYGILGDWGSGKTSAMRLLQARLERTLAAKTRRYIPIWFNPWKYENEENILYPLIYAIEQDHRRRTADLASSTTFANRVVDVVATSALALTDLGLRAATKKLTGESIKLEDVSKHFQQVREHSDDVNRVLHDWADQVAHLDQAFANLIRSFATDLSVSAGSSPDDYVFVVFVDDLDRCLPETAIAVLEGIKNFLTVPQCIFILGLNPYVVYQGIRIKYKGLDIRGQEYLEKILNYSFYMPNPTPHRIAAFGKANLSNLLLDSADVASNENRLTEFGNVLSTCNFNNPRKIKRILNRYLYFIQKFESEIEQYTNRSLIQLLIMAEYFPDVFQAFLSDADSAKQIFSNIHTREFDVRAAEEALGIPIAPIHNQLARMHKLFDMPVATQPNTPTLTKHAEAVFEVARLP